MCYLELAKTGRCAGSVRMMLGSAPHTAEALAARKVVSTLKVSCTLSICTEIRQENKLLWTSSKETRGLVLRILKKHFT
jgi:hypothetical protein